MKPKCKENIAEDQTVERLFAACEDLLDKVILILMVFGGMRVGEVAHCRQDWWNGTTIRVPKNRECDCFDCIRDPKHPGIWQPKTAEAVRMIPFEPVLRKPISLYFKANQAIDINRVSIWRRLKGMARRAGIPDNIFPHALRATYITRLLEKRVPDWVVRQLAGHKNVATTSEYAKLSEKLIHDELSKAWNK